MKQDPSHRSGERRAGQGLVEFALLLPLLLLILLGAIDLGRAFYVHVAITNASREGARFGIANPPADPTTDPAGDKVRAIKQRAIAEAASSGVSIAEGDIRIRCFTYGSTTEVNCWSAYNGDELRVTITHNFEFVTLYLFRIPQVLFSTFTAMAITNGLTPS